MYLFSQPWCGACKRLKADFEANGDVLVPISKQFLMVNVHGDDNKMFGVRSPAGQSLCGANIAHLAQLLTTRYCPHTCTLVATTT